MLERALASLERLYGPEDPGVVVTLMNLSDCLQQL
jgi:hypothetical protein